MALSAAAHLRHRVDRRSSTRGRTAILVCRASRLTVFDCLGNFVFQMVHLQCNDIQDGTRYSIKLIPVQLNERGETEETHVQTRGLPSLGRSPSPSNSVCDIAPPQPNASIVSTRETRPWLHERGGELLVPESWAAGPSRCEIAQRCNCNVRKVH